MRVSSTVKNYIQKQVKLRLEPKYEPMKLKAQRAHAIYTAAIERADAEIEAFVCDKIAEVLEAHPEFTGTNQMPRVSSLKNYIIEWNGDKDDRGFDWHFRFNTEVQDTVENILIKMELGGTKRDLERLLDEVGKEAE